MDLGLQTIVPLLAYVLIGRVVLSLLPAGWPGLHRGKEAWVTLAVSFALGRTTYLVQQTVAIRLGWEPGFWVLALPWLAVGGLRMAFGPGALRPRHEPPSGRADALAQGLFALGWVVWAAYFGLTWQEWGFGFAFHAFAILLAGAGIAVAGLERARRSARAHGLAWLSMAVASLAIGAFELSSWSWVVCFLALGLTGTIGWLRRADRRALALAAIGFGAAGTAVMAGPLAAAGLIALVVCTPAASRRRALAWSAATGGFVLLLLWACYEDTLAYTLPQRSLEPTNFVWLVPLFALPLTVIWVKLAQPANAAAISAAIDPPRRELAAYGLTLSLAIAGAALADAAGAWPAFNVIPFLVCATIVFLLLAFAPSERLEPVR